MKKLSLLFLLTVFFLSSFNTYATLQTPVFKWFDNGDTIYGPNFGPAVDKITGVEYYRFQLDTTPLFNSPLFHDTFHTNYYYITPKFPLGSTIYVRVKYYSTSDSSDWNSPYHVWVSDKMRLGIPANGTTGSFSYLSWYNFDFPAYEIMIDTSPNYNSPLLYHTTYHNLFTTRVKWDSFLFDTKYYWKVRALGDTDTTLWSDTWTFIYASPTPSITYPSFGKNYIIRSATSHLVWDDPGMCNIYYQFSKDPGFSTIDVDGFLYDDGKDHRGDVRFLDYDSKYYVRLKFITQLDSSTGWATGGAFLTLDPRITDPYNGRVFSMGGGTIKWYGDYDDEDTFEVQVDTNINFNSPIVDTFSTKLQMAFVPENIGTTYYTRVRAMHHKDTSEWSDYRYFKTPDINHYSLFYSPKDNATDVEPNFGYRWASALYKMPYIEVMLDTSPDFSSTQFQRFIGDNLGLNDIAPEYLHFGQTYYWKFRFGIPDDTSDWSQTYRFTTWGGLVSNHFPPNGARNWGTHTNLMIKDPNVDGIEFYIYQLDTTPAFNSPVLQMNNDSVLTTIETDGPFFLGQEYYWRIACANRNDTSDWGDVWNFQSLITYLDKPENNTKNLNTTILLEWYGDSDLEGYLLQIDTTDLFTSNIIKVTDGFNSEYTVTNLLNGYTYFWRVKPFHEFDTGSWSEVYQFTVKSLPALYSPLLYKPNNNAVDVPYKNGVKFDWEYNGENGIRYQLQVSDVNDFSNLLYDTDFSFYSTTLTGFQNHSTYHWRVRYKRSNGDKGPWSDRFRFTTLDENVSIQDFSDNGFLMYPNPARDRLFIETGAPSDLVVTDLQGKIIHAGRLDQELTELDISSFDRGIYLVKLVTASGSFVDQFVKD